MAYDEERTEVRSVEVPGMMIIAQFTLGGQGRSVQFSQSIDGSFHQNEIDDILDKLARAADRQAARYGLPDRRRQLAMTLDKLADDKKRVADMKDELQGFKNKRLEDARSMEKEYGRLYDNLYREHIESGRQTAFVPHGAKAQELARMKEAIAQLSEPVGGREADLIRNLSETEAKVAEAEVLVKRQREIIEEDERVANGEDVSGV